MHRKILGTDRLKSPLGTAFPRDFITFRFGKQDKDSKYLDGQYAAFGHIVDGIDVLDMIAPFSELSAPDPPDPVMNFPGTYRGFRGISFCQI